MSDIKNILILCTGNSARSILGEALINKLGEGRFKGYSAGSQPKDAPNPFALKCLQNKGYDISFARSKSWDVFSGPDAPELHFVFTVCDSAGSEQCPLWIGTPFQAHWGIEDPAAVEGSDEEIAQAFDVAYDLLEKRIAAFMALPFDDLNDEVLISELKKIGNFKR